MVMQVIFAAKSIPIFLSKHKNTLIFLVIFQNEHLDRSNFLFDYPYFFIYIMLKQAFEFICSSLNHWAPIIKTYVDHKTKHLNNLSHIIGKW